MISEQVRAAELDIDATIRRLPIWSCQKDLLLKGLVDFWRDGLELALTKYAHSTMFQNAESFEEAKAIEHQVNTGVFWCLKWALEYAPNVAATGPTAEQLVDTVVKVGAAYQIFVDALKFATVGGNELDIDTEKRTLIIYEGGNVSGHDHAMVSLAQTSLLFRKQTPLVEDSDQLTTGWTAGEYRSYWQWLGGLAASKETESVLAQAGPLAAKQEVFKRPVVVELPAPPSALSTVQKDLTLTQHKIDTGMKWKIAEWQDCPLVQIGSHIYGISTCLRTLAGYDDHMLRVAVLNDREQYDKTSGLREERMIALSRAAFEGANWQFQAHVRLKNPPREIDGYAAKGQQDLVIQLKSTLRPQSPWEVYKRNTDVIDGINHTADVLSRFREGALGFVVTDGYEGDYSTWVESLRTRVPIATLRDLVLIADDPIAAFDVLAKRAGIEGSPTFDALPERVTDLCGWTLRVIDSTKPK